jgi:hypothetical protein
MIPTAWMFRARWVMTVEHVAASSSVRCVSRLGVRTTGDPPVTVIVSSSAPDLQARHLDVVAVIVRGHLDAFALSRC